MRLSDIMSAAGLTTWTELALVICFVAFLGIVVYLYAVRRGGAWDEERNLPLEDGNLDCLKGDER